MVPSSFDDDRERSRSPRRDLADDHDASQIETQSEGLNQSVRLNTPTSQRSEIESDYMHGLWREDVRDQGNPEYLDYRVNYLGMSLAPGTPPGPPPLTPESPPGSPPATFSFGHQPMTPPGLGQAPVTPPEAFGLWRMPDESPKTPESQ